MARSHVADAQRTLELLTSTAAEMKIDADYTKVCYVEAHAHALELVIDHEATSFDFYPTLDDAKEDLPMLKYHNRIDVAVANQVEIAAANATNKLQHSTRRLTKIASQKTFEIEVLVKRIDTSPSKMPAATAEKIKERAAHDAEIYRLMFAVNGTCHL